ncbi:MAG: CobW-like GTP-binding protein [Methanomassiliicoccales archaeon]|nr:CobW-like GTP-binding protein [Methanomassiliicoccales archaeon]
MATRIAIIGGFLGAGKTTLLINLAKRYKQEGKSVAIIMNDQGEVLVDTQFAKQMGFDTAEVLKGCFCCKFPELIDNARRLVQTNRPDIILAEPVGSCTDLLATVVAPLKFRFPDEFNVAPLAVLLDSTRISDEVEDEGSLGAYLRKHQVQEAEVIVLSKMDLVAPEEMDGLLQIIKDMNPGARVIPYSGINKQGVSQIAELLVSNDKSLKRPVDVDYELYAQAEAELGWYNGSYQFELPNETDTYDLATKVLRNVARSFENGKIAHVKLLLDSPTSAMKMSLVFSDIGVDGVKGGRKAKGKVVLNLNARVISSPDQLREVMRRSVTGVLDQSGAIDVSFSDDCFSPGRPNPTYRMREDSGA